MQKTAWTIGIYTGSSPFNLSAPPNLTNPVIVPEAVTDLAIDIVAHPFIARTDSIFHLFFTAKNGQDKEYAAIGLAQSPDGFSWKYRQIVLRELHVLSYPFVFRANATHYMLAESYEEKFVRLYRAAEFPLKWEPVKDILTGDHFVSPSIVRHNNAWWLFAGCLDNATVRLFHADDLLGSFKEHPKSPIVANNLHSARPAGRPLVIDNRLYRLAQDCLPTYGRQVFAFRITEITPTTYKEEKIATPLIAATSQVWNAQAMHHVDALELSKGNWIAAVDANGTREIL